MSRFKPRVEERRFEDMGTWMLSGEQHEVPEVLRGVFFMDGNPFPEDCMVFQSFEWNADKLRIRIPQYAPLRWTFENSEDGRSLLTQISITRSCLDVRFEDETLMKAKVVPLMFGLPLPPWFILQFLLIRAENSANGDTWNRKNRLFLRSDKPYGSYTLRRVLDGDGQPTPQFDKMLEQVPETCLVIVDDTSGS